MGRLYDLLMKDYRLKEGLNACINCGTCTAICPAAEFYRYDPRKIVDIVQSKDDEEIEIMAIVSIRAASITRDILRREESGNGRRSIWMTYSRDLAEIWTEAVPEP